MTSDLTTDNDYQWLLGRISDVYRAGQLRANQAVNVCITETYWQIGHDIVEFEQGGKVRADYGKALLATLSRDRARLAQTLVPSARPTRTMSDETPPVSGSMTSMSSAMPARSSIGRSSSRHSDSAIASPLPA